MDAETRLSREEPLAPKTTFRVGGPARFYAEPANVEDLGRLWRTAQESGVDVFFLGRGSNLIVADTGFPGLVIRLQHPFWRRLEVRDGRIFARAGVRLKQLCATAASAGLRGFEFLEGIPGSLGGALRMNAGAMGGWMFDVVESVEWMTPGGEIRNWSKEQFHTDYRKCVELVDAVALGAVLRVPEANSTETSEAIRAQIDAYATVRKASQPREPSAGCIFKNPPGNHAGKLIDELGLKGRAQGGAAVSTVHGNFIINENAATCAEVIDLIRDLRARVRAERGVELEPEVFLLGAKWEEVLA
jgi:UDP-N-acetylenolpyruvoylglucosamine reductase